MIAICARLHLFVVTAFSLSRLEITTMSTEPDPVATTPGPPDRAQPSSTRSVHRPSPSLSADVGQRGDAGTAAALHLDGRFSTDRPRTATDAGRSLDAVELENATGGDHDPRNVFLDARAVMRRYGWGKTRGYQRLRDRALVPPPVMTHPDRWRLDQLQRWEDRRIAEAEPDRADPESTSFRSLDERLPAPKISRRRSA